MKTINCYCECNKNQFLFFPINEINLITYYMNNKDMYIL